MPIRFIRNMNIPYSAVTGVSTGHRNLKNPSDGSRLLELSIYPEYRSITWLFQITRPRGGIA